MANNFARHLTRCHKDDPEVQQILALPQKNKLRVMLIGNLRKRGNHLMYTMNKRITPVRKTKAFDSSKYLPCKYCLGYYSQSFLSRHVSAKHSKYKVGKGHHKVEGQNILVDHLPIDKHLKRVIFPKMRPDLCSLVAKRDPLICKYAAWYLKLEQKHNLQICTFRMRELARLLMEIRKRNSAIKNLEEALRPKYFDLLIESMKGSIKKPENLYPILRRCYDLLAAASNSNDQSKARIVKYKSLFEKNWPFDRSVSCRTPSSYNVTMLTLTENLRVYNKYLLRETRRAAELLEIEKDNNFAYRLLLETVFCTMVFFNRIDIDEIQTLPYQIFNEISSEDIKPEKGGKLTEQVLSKSIKMVVAKEDNVCILLTPELEKLITILINLRSYYVSNPSNNYLFFQVGSDVSISGHDVMLKHLTRSRIPNRDVMFAPHLQETIVNLIHILHMNISDTDHLLSLMGLIIDDEDGYQIHDAFEIAKIAKILAGFEQHDDDKFLGKSLNDIEVNVEEYLLDNIYETCQKFDANIKNTSTNVNIRDTNVNIKVSNEDVKDANVNASSSTDVPKIDTNKEITKRRRMLVPWSEIQKKLAQEFFIQHIVDKKPPKRKECEQLKQQNLGVFDNKTWEQIKVYIQNVYCKKSQLLLVLPKKEDYDEQI
ncbi:uncharacterized protein LOC115890407 [Sitophilus oryzae]|uniref:Uncharacterized protein LOC115890407 n=1 Tax=Sitophilus oryzae TaxID=7048 RepID=A0A6J2YTG0_SITOR|nr:uncharacterized protein LOC115890407 [Sitophilus oryzae]